MKSSKKPSSSSKQHRPKDIDSYLSSQPDEFRMALQGIRETVRAVAPEAEEAYVYGVPGFKLGGRPLVCYAGFKHHCGFYPMSPAVMKAHAADLKDYDTSEGTIRFQAEKPLPAALVKKLVKARMAELKKDDR
jgi:uncharacterized protein YdhG (YjbR/CyaY superfamily)